MALINRKALLETVSNVLQAKRFRGKINLKRPRQPHFDRAKYLAFTQPYYPKREEKPLVELCTKGVKFWDKSDVENPFQRLIANELRNYFETSRLIAFYHLNPMSSDQQFRAYVLFKKQNMHYKNYGKKTLEMAINDTQYETVKQFYVSHNMMVFSPEPNIKQLLKITKRFPQLILLAGILEGRLISKDELVAYGAIPNLQAAQSQLVQTLSSIGGQVASQLTTHQNTLVSQLQERIKQLEEK